MGLLDFSPSEGGLLARNLPAPYGLRAYKKQDGTYGGEMMPKGLGWLGMQPNPQGGFSTELSAEDESGSFPLMYYGMPGDQLQKLLNTPEGHMPDKDIYKKAREMADILRSMGHSPFREIWE